MDMRNSNSDRNYRIAAQVGVGSTFVALAAILVMVVVDPTYRSVLHVYINAALDFCRQQNFYMPEASSGFVYLPSFAVAFVPLTIFGSLTADLVWRVLSILGAWYAVWRIARRLATTAAAFELMGLSLLFALPGAAASVRNGQSTTLLLAVTYLAFDAVYDRRFASAAIWATLAVVAKPPGIVVWLLIGGAWPKSIPWLMAFLLVAMLAPFAFADASYVTMLYEQFVAMMQVASSRPGDYPEWADFMAIFRTIELPLDLWTAYIIRGVAAVLAIASLHALKWKSDYLNGVVVPATLACSYMLLFNPRAEVNTYLLMALPYSLLAAYMLRETRQKYSGWAVAFACMALGTGAFGHPVMDIFDPWSKPLLLIFSMVICYFALIRKKAFEGEPVHLAV